MAFFAFIGGFYIHVRPDVSLGYRSLEHYEQEMLPTADPQAFHISTKAVRLQFQIGLLRSRL